MLIDNAPRSSFPPASQGHRPVTHQGYCPDLTITSHDTTLPVAVWSSRPPRTCGYSSLRGPAPCPGAFDHSPLMVDM
ncbi:hypothetical protein ACFW9F_06475 [Streptomyces sp. NPDC059506]|uniref:hypothetical protein n=1 Tax=Streptomyces sp. NPDC059506 TaxID=3347751 RepID=UPI00367EB361